MRARFAIAVVALGGVLGGELGPVEARQPEGRAPNGAAVLDALPWDHRIGLEQALASGDARYAPRMDEGAPVLESPGSVVATFTTSGARLAFGSEHVEMLVVAIGRAGSLGVVDRTGRPVVAGAEVRTVRGDGVLEWWRSLPSGLEHGVTIAERPAGEGELQVEVEARGDLSAQLLSDDAVALRNAAGDRIAIYAHLVVLDAAGVRVPARMALDGAHIVLAIDDADARYPLVVDPLVTAQEATLLAPDGAPSDQLGISVALSSDGSRALVGVTGDGIAVGTNSGSARVFLRTGTTWAQEATLLAPDGAPSDQLGISVALSADGSRALVGVQADDTAAGLNAGSARVFLRTGTTWAQEAALLAPDGAADDQFGFSVALSSDGSRALVGAWIDDTAGGVDAGSARVFLRTGSMWVQEATLLAPDGAAGDAFGRSVALSSDGSRALVGAYQDDTAGGVDVGSARVFLRTGTMWAQEATLLAPDGAASDVFGVSVALSSDGSVALVGAWTDDTAGGVDAGSARVFLRTGTTWAQEATLLAPDGMAADGFGSSVALSSDGSRALVGATSDDTAGGTNAGSARVFLRTGTAWAQEATLVAPDGAPSEQFANSVALTSDASRALVGAWRDNTAGGTFAGSARVFTIALAPNGSGCSTDTVCLSGFCTDGVCCSTRCGGGPSDCQACSAALTGGPDGTCAPLSAAVASTVTCRAAATVCDVAETCTSTSATCPADVLASATTVCRAPSGLCDVAETCTGTSAACPADALASAGTTCRTRASDCDAAEVCTGTGAACPVDAIAPSGTTCRAAAGGCDIAEVCDGVAIACPGDAFAGAGSVCRSALGTCDLEEQCPGGSPMCPADLYAPATMPCGSAVSGDCDAPDHCTGTSADCLAVYLSGVECRASRGGCDPAEVCAGSAPSCPPDAVEPFGMVCRASTDTSCDPAESCDGTATSCPADVTSCAPRPDAGGTDAGRADASTTSPDAGGTPAPAAGCACRATSDRSPIPAALFLVLAVALVFRRRGRARL